jgi:hypothetical protein
MELWRLAGGTGGGEEVTSDVTYFQLGWVRMESRQRRHGACLEGLVEE